MIRCRWTLVAEFNRVQCEQPAIAALTAGCVNEHIDDQIRVCGEHLEMYKKRWKSAWCALCQDLGGVIMPVTLLDERPLDTASAT